MRSCLRLSRGAVKPPIGAIINPDHPFSRGLLVCVPFYEGFFASNLPPSNGGFKPIMFFGNMRQGVPTQVSSTDTSWGSNKEGICQRATTGNSTTRLGTDFIPATGVTVLLIRRKHDTTARAAALFGGSTTNAQKCNAHAPFSDGVVYWDFGGVTAPNRLSVSGLTFSTTIPERWVFTAGRQGSSIWRNGVKLASQTTAITRTVGTAQIDIGSGPASASDFEDRNFYQFNDHQWSDNLIRWWSAEPYAHLYPMRPRRWMDIAGSGALVTTGARSRTFAWGFS